MFDAERSAFEGYLKANWTITPVAYDNVPFSPGDIPFIRVAIVGGKADQITLGTGPQLHRRPGLCIIQVFVKAGTGTKVANDLGDALCDIFRSQQLATGIACGSPYPVRVGDDGRGWFQINVMIPYLNDAIKGD